jgi:hypothetical protein
MLHGDYNPPRAQRLCRSRYRQLWTQDYAPPATPAFRQPHPHHFHLRVQIAQQRDGSGMKTQCRRHQVNDWRIGLQDDAGKMSLAREVLLFQMPLDP